MHEPNGCHTKQYSLTDAQVSGCELDMVMSTKEQGAFEKSLCTSCGGLELIKAGMSRVDVREVRAPP